MKIRVPDYYDEFKCIADKCTDTCCAGWQVDVDDKSFAYYKTIKGEFGDRLHSVMIESTEKKDNSESVKMADVPSLMTICSAIYIRHLAKMHCALPVTSTQDILPSMGI